MDLSVGGARAYVYTGGRPASGAAPAVVFLHGAASDHSVFVLQTRYLAHHGWDVLAPDLPAHGRSDGPALGSVPEMADWVLALLAAAGVARATLVGHSMGSLVALEAAARGGERVQRVALLGCAVPMRVSAALLASAAAGEHAALDMINLWSHSAAGQRGPGPVPGQWVLGTGMRLLERRAAPLHGDFLACDRYDGALAAAAAVRCPALLVSGARDQMTPPRAVRELAGRLARARTVVLEGAGHDLMGECPDALLDSLLAFLREPLDQGT